jgi:hypothetical protein
MPHSRRDESVRFSDDATYSADEGIGEQHAFPFRGDAMNRRESCKIDVLRFDS